MSNVTTEQKPPRSTSSPFGKFQVIGLLAAAMVALLVALPYVNGEKGSRPGATATPPVQSESTVDPQATPTAPPVATSAAYDDCIAGGLTGCEALREPDSAAAESYEQCRVNGRPPDECLAAAIP